jgi:acyl-CoA thioesterase-1
VRLLYPCVLFAAAAAVAAVATAFADPTGGVSPGDCAAPVALTTIAAPLPRTAARIKRGEALTIVAMGSSSTLGVGASSPAMSYPSRLERELAEIFPGASVRVLNRGVGGEDVRHELARLGRDVIAEKPDLVIWQLGTNAVLRRDDVGEDRALISGGVAALRESGIDVVLMDVQFAPRVLARPALGEMERIIAEVAARSHVGLFRRFEIMQEWARAGRFAGAAGIGPDGLHMTDASYGCLAHELAESLGRNYASGVKVANSPERQPAAIAGLGRAETPRSPR